MSDLDTIVIADDDRAAVRVAGLTVRERAIRVARRVGATRVHVVDDATARAALPRWRADRSAPLLVIRADQLVHTPLVAALVKAIPQDGLATSVGPTGAYAGAFVATGAAAEAALTALARGDADAAFVASTPGVVQVPHGEIACHPVGTPAERRAAHRMLYRILIKPQDNAITRYLYRPISFPLTRLLAWTPITPNQISYLVGALVVLGCWLTAHASPDRAIAGTVTLLVASYIDCCDGEIARLKLLSSRFGAWIDTVIDEASTIGYMVALGWHCHLRFGPHYLGDLGFDPWIVAAVVSVVTYATAMFCIYYNIIVAIGSANSQDYTPNLEVVPGARPNSVRFQAIPPRVTEPRSGLVHLAAMYLPYIVRRDFLSWVATLLAITHLTQVSFASQVIGGVITLAVTLTAHVKLVRMRRAIARAGQHIEAPG